MLEVEDKTPLPTPDGPETETPAFRDEEGEINPEFLAAAADAIEASEVERLQKLVEDFHESELGDLLEALEPDQRPRLIELLGSDFDFAALTEVDDSVREEILEELETATVAEGVRDLDSDDAVTILESLDDEDRRTFSTSCPPSSAWRSSAPSTTRKTAPAGACRPSSSPCRRSGRSGRRSTSCARRRTCRRPSTRSSSSIRPATCSARSPSTGFCAPSAR